MTVRLTAAEFAYYNMAHPCDCHDSSKSESCWEMPLERYRAVRLAKHYSSIAFEFALQRLKEYENGRWPQDKTVLGKAMRNVCGFGLYFAEEVASKFLAGLLGLDDEDWKATKTDAFVQANMRSSSQDTYTPHSLIHHPAYSGSEGIVIAA